MSVACDTVSNAVAHSSLDGYGTVNLFDDISKVRDEISSYKAFVWNKGNIMPLCESIAENLK